ncbi:uncharacterized protein LOC123548935 [Mercenaria mercenaria]|uniref:uncharacterized protein LOC123548935 n=1 Tax=Mercenaria mercenaria TaxID=6596 RepID=UPI00234F638C|nr:uncharacterized protein LOC123548935 [Mercenaria mercenaria]XP_045192526.2 uncharacterized protein LOC123548935 [Mercenaria mercenaria]
MSVFTYEDYTGNVYRLRKRILVTIFSQPFPLNAGDDRYLEKRMMEDRHGYRSDVDAGYLQDLFKRIHYPETADVRLKNRLRKDEIKQYIKDLGSSQECLEYDTFFFAFLTYLSCENTGSTVYRDERIHLDDGLCPLQDIYDEVKNVEAMRMKPKVFLIQADDISLLFPIQYIKGEKIVKPLKIPQDADRLVIMSDIPQRFANRSRETEEKNPSFLIKAFCDSLVENSQRSTENRLDLLSLTTVINNKVRVRIGELNKAGVERAKDMHVPLVTSTLTKLVTI